MADLARFGEAVGRGLGWPAGTFIDRSHPFLFKQPGCGCAALGFSQSRKMAEFSTTDSTEGHGKWCKLRHG
jgi:hypothetical protein